MIAPHAISLVPHPVTRFFAKNGQEGHIDEQFNHPQRHRAAAIHAKKIFFFFR